MQMMKIPCRLFYGMVIVMITGCARINDQRQFENVFGFSWLSEVPIKETVQRTKGDPIFHATISKEQANEIGRRSQSVGYERWREMSHGETYGNDNFNIESRRESPIIVSIKKNPAGHRFRLFFNQSNGDFYAVSFYN